MDDELVQNVAMGEKFVKNFVMDPPIFKIGGWNILQPSNRKLLKESIEEDAYLKSKQISIPRDALCERFEATT